MPKPSQFIYEKKEPFRDAFYFIIVCEGQNREPDYFRFFDGISSRIKIVPVESSRGESSPTKLIKNAIEKEEELDTNDDIDTLWFVIDTDKWESQIHILRKECESHPHWSVAQSNPCFEVWLYFHVKNTLPDLPHMDQCNNWKPHVNQILKGGFNPDIHPVAIETATTNAKACFNEDGYSPRPGSTQVWRLTEKLMPLIKKDLYILKSKFPFPELFE